MKNKDTTIIIDRINTESKHDGKERMSEYQYGYSHGYVQGIANERKRIADELEKEIENIVGEIQSSTLVTEWEDKPSEFTTTRKKYTKKLLAIINKEE